MTLINVLERSELGGLATRKARGDEFQSVRKALVPEEVAKGWIADKENLNTTRLKKSKSPDRLFEDRVWSLFFKMGFDFMSGQGGAFVLLNENDPKGPDNQLDAVAIDDDTAIAIECKSSQSPKKLNNFSADLAKFVSLKERFTRAVRNQFECKHKRPSIFAFWTFGIIVTDSDKQRAEAAKVPLLDETDLEYYEQLTAQIGSAAKYQFLSDLMKNRPIDGLEIKVPAIRSRLGGATAYTFSIPPEYLLKIAFVSHRAKGKASDIDAYQRLLKKQRMNAIKQYISDGGFFPTNIVVNIASPRWLTFDRAKQEGDDTGALFGWLTIRPAFKVAWIIDGQHRLFAYADHPLAKKSLVSVMAFVGLEPSEQARLFIDINAEQRKVKQSLLQELFAELHWNAEEPEERVQAILSKTVQMLDAEITSPFKGRVLKADEVKSDQRCITLTSMFKALEDSSFHIARIKAKGVIEYGPFWTGDNQRTLKRTVTVVSEFFNSIRANASSIWDIGSGEGGGLAMNDGITVCFKVLRSIMHHLQTVKRADLGDLSDREVVEVIAPYGSLVGRYFSELSGDQLKQFRALRGSQGATTGTRRVEEYISKIHSDFDPPGLKEYLARATAETTKEAFNRIHSIEGALQRAVLSELKAEFGSDEQSWFFGAVPKNTRKKVDDRINEDGAKKGGREENFDLIDYRDIIHQNWQLFEKQLARGKGGAKDVRTKWIVEVNELRKSVMHASKGKSLPITEEQLALLVETDEWLSSRLSSADDD